MSALMAIDTHLTMSSREIAELVESRHDNVKVTIERLVARGVIASPATQEKPTAGRPVVEYLVCKRDSYVIVAQLSPEFTARLVDRWQELEARAAAPELPNFADPVAAARAWADAKESELNAVALAREQAARLEAQKPAVEFVARYVAADGPKGFRQVCQLLNVPNEREFAEFLVEKGFMYRLEGKLVPMANQRHTGRFVIKAGVTRDTEHAFNQTKFTPKGVEWIAGEWAKYQVQEVATA